MFRHTHTHMVGCGMWHVCGTQDRFMDAFLTPLDTFFLWLARAAFYRCKKWGHIKRFSGFPIELFFFFIIIFDGNSKKKKHFHFDEFIKCKLKLLKFSLIVFYERVARVIDVDVVFMWETLKR